MLNIHAESHLPSKCQTLVIVPDSVCYGNWGKFHSHPVTLTLV